MRLREIFEDGRIVKGVNTTVDVGSGEIKTQAAKFGNTVDKDGRPPTLSKKVKGKSTNVLFNLGLSESRIRQLEASYEGNIGIMELMKFFSTAPSDLVTQVKQLIKQKKDKEVWKIVQQYTGTKLKGKEFDVEEGWKDWVAGATLGAATLGANAGNIVQQPVEKGDTVYSIARQNDTTPAVLYKLNGFDQNTKLQLGQMVKVPDTAEEETPQAKKPQVKKDEPITINAHEKFLIKTATAAGIKGTELAAFLSQVAHESHDFKSMVEYGGSLDFRKYDPKYAPRKAKILGNTKAGDGAKYKGRGYIQITGRYNYGIAGKAIGIDLVNNPKLAEKPSVAAKIAIWYWKLRVQPNVDDFSNVRDVTKPINSGLRGLEDRESNFDDYKTIVASL
jgi:putative chitinase